MSVSDVKGYRDDTNLNVKLRPEVKVEWLKALRSGDYKQAKQTLCRIVRNNGNAERRFCCLGVLSDLYILAWNEREKNNPAPYNVGWEERTWRNGTDKGKKYVAFVSELESTEGMPADEVVKYAYGENTGKATSNGPWNIFLDEKDAKRFIPKFGQPYRNQVTLPELNDKGVKFETIAYLIEKYL